MKAKKDGKRPEAEGLLETLQRRFAANEARHPGVDWSAVRERIEGRKKSLATLLAMEETGGEPDVIAFDEDTGAVTFCDCSAQTPTGRVSLCYDAEALAARKQHKPAGSAVEAAAAMGVKLLTEEQYLQLQQLGEFDTKTSSWLATPAPVRKLGGALFGDRRFGRVFVYHNGAESYYAARGFRGVLYV